MIHFRFILTIPFFFVFSFSGLGFAADEDSRPLLYKTVFGMFLHDKGPASDRHESGVDPNWELQFNAPQWKLWQWIGSPYSMIGLTPNFKGGTSTFYGGLNYEFSLSSKYTDKLTYGLTKNLFIAGNASLALHNGPLHKDTVGCEERSDCGFGYRVLPRLGIELGTAFLRNYGVSVFYGHMSHKGILPGENEGIDHIGIRYHFSFNKPRPQS